MPDQEKHYFFTVLLTDKYLQSSLVSNNGQGIQIKEFSEIKAYFDRKDLLEQLDKSLQQLGEESQDVVETIFAFDQDWLEDGELSDTKKPIVKEISEELSLHAIGQFSIPEALAEARLIGDENDSCLLLIFKEDSFSLVFLKHGEFVDLINVGRSDDIINDFTEALARAAKKLGHEGKYFPNKILMTSMALRQKELDSLHEKLIKVDWTSNPGFTQTPNIVVLETDYMIKSASLSAGKIFTKEAFLTTLPKNKPASLETDELIDQAELPSVEVPVVPSPQTPELGAVSADEYAIEKPTASSFGINFDHNFVDNSSKNQTNPSLGVENKEQVESITSHKDHRKRSPLLRFYLNHQKIILIGMATGLLGILSIFTIFAIFFSKVRIVLTPQQILLQKTATIALDPNIANSDFSKNLLKASLENKEINGQDVTATTGIGLVGDKAKGKVIIYNKTLEKVKLKQGTILTSNNIKFLLDEEVELPAAEEKDSGLNYGKLETTVTANDIGSEANFNKDTKFRVADYFDDKFSATAEDNFSGGSSREVRVVAEVDLNRLTKSLSDKLFEEAKKELDQSSKDGVYLVPTGKIKTLKSDFSAQLGAETESLTLDLTLELEVVKYFSTDLKDLAASVLEKELPEGYVFKDEPSLMSDKAQTASDSSRVKLNAEVSSKAVASLDVDDLRKETLGKDLLEAKNILENKEEIKQVDFIFTPPFLANMLKKLPTDESRIVVQITK